MTARPPSIKPAGPPQALGTQQHIQRLIDYYTEAGLDYQQWSKQFNMHFGFYRWGMNPLDLEGMLNQMNHEVIRHLALDRFLPQHILDMGCGPGATARYAAARMANVRVSGVTIVPWQLELAAQLTEGSPVHRRVCFVAGDYTASPFPANSFDGVYALESSCYAPGYAKEPLMREMYRVLKPGSRFVVADAFLKTTRKMNPLMLACYKALCDCWSLETMGEIHQFTLHLESLGFTDIRVKNISKNVTPSVLHIPKTIVRFLTKELLFQRSKVHPKRMANMMAGVFLIAFAMDRTRSGYFMVSGAKGDLPSPRSGANDGCVGG